MPTPQILGAKNPLSSFEGIALFLEDGSLAMGACYGIGPPKNDTVLGPPPLQIQ